MEDLPNERLGSRQSAKNDLPLDRAHCTQESQIFARHNGRLRQGRIVKRHGDVNSRRKAFPTTEIFVMLEGKVKFLDSLAPSPPDRQVQYTRPRVRFHPRPNPSWPGSANARPVVVMGSFVGRRSHGGNNCERLLGDG